MRELTDDRHRFVTGPRLSPDGRRAVWLAWDHPRMPWDGTELRLADVAPDDPARRPHRWPGGPGESVAQADWTHDGRLLHTSDRTGWWNLYLDGEPVCPREEEFGGPLWKPGSRWFTPLDSGLIAVVHGRGAATLGILDPERGEVVDVAGPWTEFTPTLAAHGERVVAVGASPRSAHEVVEMDTRTGRARVIGTPHKDAVDPAHYPQPQVRTFSGPDGREIHAQVYPPRNPDCAGPDGELPPNVIWAHGGPTGRAPLVLDLEIAYFTSRGIGVAEVNYGGSTGYGRAYRDRLREQWGVVDVEDCAAVALALADEGTAARDRLAVRGGSAGGWTTAASLTTTDIYACGTIIYPVLDLTGSLERPTTSSPGTSRASSARAPKTPSGTPNARPPHTPTGSPRRSCFQVRVPPDLPSRAVRAVPRPPERSGCAGRHLTFEEEDGSFLGAEDDGARTAGQLSCTHRSSDCRYRACRSWS
ncbi:prolyl oligopeptidase family serine peptidase [Streptomyces hirsutus]